MFAAGMVLLLPCLGCSRHPEAIAKVIEHQAINDNVEFATHDEVLRIHREFTAAVITDAERMCTVLETIHDNESALAAARDWQANSSTKPAFDSTVVKNNQVRIQMNDVEFERLSSDIDAANDAASKQMESITTRQKSVVSRIANDPKIGMEARMRLDSTMLGLSALAKKLQELGEKNVMLLRRYPPELRATVVMNRIHKCDAMGPYLSNKVKAKLFHANEIDSYYAIELSPVSDLPSLIQAIDIGAIENIDESHRIVEIHLGDKEVSELAAIEDGNRKRIAEEQSLVKQTQEANNRQLKLKNADTFKQSALQAKQTYMESLDKLWAHLQRIDSVPSYRDHIGMIKSEVNASRHAKAQLDRSKGSYRSLAQEELDIELIDRDSLEKIDIEIGRLKLDYKLRALLATSFGKNVSAEELLNVEAPPGGYTNPAEDPKHPEFFGANLVDLMSERSINRRDALTRLKRIEPSEVADVELRKEITRTIRDIAVEEHSFDQMAAAECLCKWAGRHSVTYLGEILRKHRSSSDRAILMNLLAQFPSDESARIVCEWVGDRSNSEAACLALVKMGSVAEEAVLEITPVPDPLQCLSGVRVLGEIGTKKSLPLLQKARASSNRDVKEAAREAARKISTREP